MARAIDTIDVTDTPELRRIAEEVRATREPVVLRTGDEDIAIVVPIEPGDRGRWRSTTEADDIASRASFGGWSDIVDADQLKREIAEARGSDRPVPDL